MRLTALAGAKWVDLEVFPPSQAVALLARVVGQQRVEAQPADAEEVVRLCGHLPLAVRIAGARLAARPTWRLADFAAMLADERRRLDLLSVGDLEVRASLALSYQGLAPQARRLFQLLGLFEAPDFPAWLAVAVLAAPTALATERLEELVDAQLLTISDTRPGGAEPLPFPRSRSAVRTRTSLGGGRSGAPAALPPWPPGSPPDASDAPDASDGCTAALRRGLGGWLAVAETMAEKVPGPCFAAIHGSAPRPEVDWSTTETMDADPLEWFDEERGALVSAVHQACELKLDELAFDLAGCLEKYFDLRGMYADWRSVNQSVMVLCQASGNLRGQAVMLRGLIDVVTWNSTADPTADPTGEAMTRLRTDSERLLAMFTELGDERGMADAAVMCSWGMVAQGAYPEAVQAARRVARAGGVVRPSRRPGSG